MNSRSSWNRTFSSGTSTAIPFHNVTSSTIDVLQIFILRKSIKLRRVRITIVAEKKHQVLHILSVCLQPYSSSTQSACAVLYCHLWPIWFYHIFPHYLTNGTIFRGKSYRKWKVCLDFLRNFILKNYHSKHNSLRRIHKRAQLFMQSVGCA